MPHPAREPARFRTPAGSPGLIRSTSLRSPAPKPTATHRPSVGTFTTGNRNSTYLGRCASTLDYGRNWNGGHYGGLPPAAPKRKVAVVRKAPESPVRRAAPVRELPKRPSFGFRPSVVRLTAAA